VGVKETSRILKQHIVQLDQHSVFASGFWVKTGVLEPKPQPSLNLPSQHYGNTVVRVNNHEHTDIQEYIGSYTLDSSGRLVFKLGVLAKAMQAGS
jgi:hypothetical protein